MQLNDATQGVTWWRWHALGLGNQKRKGENGLDQERERYDRVVSSYDSGALENAEIEIRLYFERDLIEVKN